MTNYLSPVRSLLLILIGIFICLIPACRKTVVDQSPGAENIQINEIKDWEKWYSKTIPNAPKMLLSGAEKTFYKGRFYVRVPLQGSTGMFYFGKDQSLEVVFMRIVPDKVKISYPFTGIYELIDMNKFSYRRMSFVNGEFVKNFQSLGSTGSVSGIRSNS